MTTIIDEEVSADTIDAFIQRMAKELLEAADQVLAKSKQEFQDSDDSQHAEQGS